MQTIRPVRAPKAPSGSNGLSETASMSTTTIRLDREACGLLMVKECPPLLKSRRGGFRPTRHGRGPP